VIDLLEGRDRPEMTTDVARKSVCRKQGDALVSCYDEVASHYARHGGVMPSREAIASEIKAWGEHGPEAALCNGLDDAQNRELFVTTDPIRIAELVLTGLLALGL
jgi:hypothetical protein